MKKKSKTELFLELAKPDDEGFSRKVYVDEFVRDYSGLIFGNGGSWCREDGALGKKYNISRHKEKGAIRYVQLHGLNKTAIERAIRSDIYQQIKSMRCAILGTSKPECDHKDGRLDNPRLKDTQTQKPTDFQPLSKAANTAKRQHCKECKETNNRFDARKLGFNQSQIKGDGEYRGSCVGCYWYDPKKFCSASSK